MFLNQELKAASDERERMVEKEFKFRTNGGKRIQINEQIIYTSRAQDRNYQEEEIWPQQGRLLHYPTIGNPIHSIIEIISF